MRSFNQQGAEVLDGRPFGGLRALNFVARDDPAARGVVRELAEAAGLLGVEVGPLAASRWVDPVMLFWVAVAQVRRSRDFALTLLRR